MFHSVGDLISAGVLERVYFKTFFSGENIYKQEYFSIVGTRHLKNGGALLEVHYCV
jgi:hypothetical protein